MQIKQLHHTIARIIFIVVVLVASYVSTVSNSYALITVIEVPEPTETPAPTPPTSPTPPASPIPPASPSPTPTPTPTPPASPIPTPTPTPSPTPVITNVPSPTPTPVPVPQTPAPSTPPQQPTPTTTVGVEPESANNDNLDKIVPTTPTQNNLRSNILGIQSDILDEYEKNLPKSIILPQLGDSETEFASYNYDSATSKELNAFILFLSSQSFLFSFAVINPSLLKNLSLDQLRNLIQ